MSVIPTQYILIVDDQPANLKVLTKTLIKADFVIDVATNGKLAVQKAFDNPPDLIVLDILMPEMDGFETCEQLKNNPITQNIPVIFMTALSDTISKIKGFSLGAVDFITKPFEPREVIARVRTHLQVRHLTKDLEKRNHQLSEALERLHVTQQQIIAQERLATIGALTAEIAYELRNPLNLVKNYAEGSIELSNDLLEEINSQSACLNAQAIDSLNELTNDLQENALAITRCAQQVADITQDMLMQARSNVNQPLPTDINSLLNRAIKLICWNPKYGFDQGIQVHTDYDQTLGKLLLVRSELSRAFINLLDNGCYALQTKQQQCAPSSDSFKPQIWIKTQRLEKAVEIRIRDNGIGIPETMQTLIFQPFVSTKPVVEGSGLGLSQTYDIIVKLLGGTLSLMSEVGNYTEFSITIPLKG